MSVIRLLAAAPPAVVLCAPAEAASLLRWDVLTAGGEVGGGFLVDLDTGLTRSEDLRTTIGGVTVRHRVQRVGVRRIDAIDAAADFSDLTGVRLLVIEGPGTPPPGGAPIDFLSADDLSYSESVDGLSVVSMVCGDAACSGGALIVDTGPLARAAMRGHVVTPAPAAGPLALAALAALGVVARRRGRGRGPRLARPAEEAGR